MMNDPSAAGPGATAVAHPNIALVKYWGKRDETLALPVTGSLSVTLDVLPTTTRVTLIPGATRDVVVLNGEPVGAGRVGGFLDLVRALAGRGERALVESDNQVPTGAGLASSAAGFAALAAAATAAYGLDLGGRELSRLARRGSGSACRSVFGGFVQWHAGSGGGHAGDLSSYAESVPVGALDPALVVAVTDTGAKAVPSRDAMRRTVATSPLYEAWARTCEKDLARMRDALVHGDITAVGAITEGNALCMHAVMLAARPAVRYLSGASLAILDAVAALRADGVPAYATVDAGPNVVVLCSRGDAARVAAVLRAAWPVRSIHVAGPGPGVTVEGGAGR
ncbi:homoserine kinase [Actinomadura rubteroloni]|uniref:diphosphomevalonate decarboxylase n=1 Tax=Actinomadura rubteroloni TaxID=1926885 RepID=A0A2P4UEX6_9ACTN|nr:diphosphomevalonate decarboxylase [Actinomadura rubteroloni]POM23586.1 homoserine kinase [Actinomadura rubteroloni]